MRQFVTEAVEAKLSRAAAQEDKPWLEIWGGLRHLRKETARIQGLIDEEFERIEPEDAA